MEQNPDKLKFPLICQFRIIAEKKEGLHFVIEKGLLKTTKSLRFYYIGPMFRAERPQAGRKRQFHQIGIEMINEPGIHADFEALSLLYRFLIYTGVSKPQLRINDLGDAEQQKKTAEALRRYFEEQKSSLCQDSHWRLEKNVLLIFDCKNESCQPVIQKAPWEKIAPLSTDFEKLTKDLETHHIPYEIKRRLVRGLDYYNGTVFEMTAEGLGSQDALAGGGRYDRLYADLGGQPAPCTGFSIGFERLLAVLEKNGRKIESQKIYVAPLDSHCEVLSLCQKTSLELRERGIRVETLKGETSLSKHLKKANQLGLRYVLILGSAEFEKGKWTLKDMEAKTQREIGIEEVVSTLELMVPGTL